MVKQSLLVFFIFGIAAVPSLMAGDAEVPPPSTKQDKAAVQAIAEADKQYKEKHYDVAAAEYQFACDHLPKSPATHAERARALAGFSMASVRLAEQRIIEGRYEDAKAAAKAVLDPKYDPNYKPAIKLLAQLDDPDYFNHTTGPRSDMGKDVKTLLKEAKGFYDTARFDLAYKRYDQVLDLDPNNTEARKGQEDVIAAKEKYANQAYSGPPARYSGPPRPMADTGSDAGKTENIRNKLDHIIIPQINFKDASVRDVMEFLHRKSIDLDTAETDPAQRGVNIVLKLDPVPEASPTAPANSIGDEKLSLSLTNIPLSAALDYVTKLAGLKMKIEPYGVIITPMGTSGIQIAPVSPSPSETPQAR